MAGITIDFNDLNLDQIKKLEKAAYDMQLSYNDLIVDISKKQKIGPLWWITSIPARDLQLSPLFLRCAYLALIKEYLDNKIQIEKIVVSDKALKKVIIDFFLKEEMVVIVEGNNYDRQRRFKKKLRIPYLFLRTLQMFQNGSKYKNILPDVKDKEITLIDTFLMDATVKKKEYSERYFNGLLSFLSEEEKESLYFFPTLTFTIRNYSKKYKLMMGYDNIKFLPQECFLNFKDYLEAWKYLANNYSYKYEEIKFKGFEISRLLDDEMRFESSNYSTMLAYLRFKAITRMKENKVSVKHVLDWFEGQPIDKATFYGFNICYPDTKTVAYNGNVGNILLNMKVKVTEEEKNNNIIAKETTVMGKGMIKPISEYCINQKIYVAPAFRFKELWEKNVDLGKRIIVALPIGVEFSKGIIKLLNQVLIENVEFHKYEIIIKKHPADDSKNYMELIKHNNVKFTNEAFSLLLEDCGLLISGASSTCLETIARGIPVVVMGNTKGLTMNTIPPEITKDIWELCYSKDDLCQAIDYFISKRNSNEKKLKKVGEEIKKIYFEPVTADAARRLLDLV